MLMLAGCASSTSVPCVAADTWGGSLGVTNDYLVRGISRSDQQAAVQVDVHFLSGSGFVAGAFASTARVDRAQATDAELSAFAGYAWSADNEWHGKALASHYAYRGSSPSNDYDYDELDLDAAYQDWFDVGVVYAPNYSRYVLYRGPVRGASTSVELNLQQPVYRKLQVTGGAGYSHVSGYESAGYVYWSLGVSLDLAPLALGLSYVDTSPGARTLFYDAAAAGRWVGTVIWRF
jgi:uncharacterized protein (TIGR02001 family)